MVNEKKIRQQLDMVKQHGWQILKLRNCGLKAIPMEIFNYPNLVTIDFGNDSFCDEENKNVIKISIRHKEKRLKLPLLAKIKSEL